MTKTYTPHKHAEVIKAWADGKTVQFKEKDSDEWGDANCSIYGQWLRFHPEHSYRIKLEEVVDYALVYETGVVAPQFCPSLNNVNMTAHACHYDLRQGFVKRTRIDGKIISFEFISK